MATDLDGTLLNSQGTLSAYSRSTLGALDEAGFAVTIMTARPLRDVVTLDGLPDRALLACGNGTLIHDRFSGVDLHRNYMPARDVEMIIDILRRIAPEVRLGGELNPELFLEDGFLLPDSAEPPTETAQHLETVLGGPGLAKLIVQLPGRATDYLRTLCSRLPTKFEVTCSSEWFCEITASGANKAEALELVSLTRGCTARNVIAFGDMPNDIPMLRWAGTSVAVANAHASLLAVADHITSSNDDDGVASFLDEKLINHSA
ncbi:HAD family hydrolase [Actinopolyspora biskrensis]